jgi:hypothetical protein
MPETIVLGYDESPSADASLKAAMRLAPTLDARVVVVFGYYISPLGGRDIRQSSGRRSRM